jgi:hypothetical protein
MEVNPAKLVAKLNLYHVDNTHEWQMNCDGDILNIRTHLISQFTKHMTTDCVRLSYSPLFLIL